MKWPKQLGACVDKLYTMRADRLKQQQKVDDLKAQEEALRLHILELLKAAKAEGAKGAVATCSRTLTTVATVTDWERFYKYVKKTNSFDLLQRRVNDAAYRARLDDKVAVPGVEPFKVESLSITKAGKAK